MNLQPGRPSPCCIASGNQGCHDDEQEEGRVPHYGVEKSPCTPFRNVWFWH